MELFVGLIKKYKNGECRRPNGHTYEIHKIVENLQTLINFSVNFLDKREIQSNLEK